DLAQYGQRAGEHRDAGLSTYRSEREWIGLPGGIFLRVTFLDFRSGHLLPPAMIDLAQAVADLHLQTIRCGGERRGFTRTSHRARVDRGNPFRGQPRAETARLH